MQGLAALSVLVVDDSRHMLTIVMSLLRGYGFKDVRQAESVEDAWRQFQHRRFDIVLVDFMLSGPPGTDLMQHIRRDPRSPAPETAIIVMTAYSDRARVVESRDAGASEIVVKPISAGSLFTRIAAVIDYRRPFIRSSFYVGPDRRRRTDTEYSGPFRRDNDNDVLDLDGPVAA